MTTHRVDPWLAGKAQLATARSNGKATAINAKADAADRKAGRREADRDRRRTERDKRKRARLAALATLGQFLLDHWSLALWLPVIVAPGVLAWTAQQGAGDDIFGQGMGWLLALFSETSAWALLAWAEIRVKAGRPATSTRVAAWLIATVGAALNYTHGSLDPGAAWHGIVMALVSISGFAVHQVAHCEADVVAALRAWWTGRAARRLVQAAQHRVDRFERAAVRSATAVLHADGTVTLRYPTGSVALTRFRRLIEATPVSLADQVTAMIERTAQVTGYRPTKIDTQDGVAPINLREHDPVTDADLDLLNETRNLINQGKLPETPTGHQIYVDVMRKSGDKARAYRVQRLLGGDRLRPVPADADSVA